jgi:hypothetical protein
MARSGPAAGSPLDLGPARAFSLFVAVLLARVWIAAHFRGNFDSQAFHIVAGLVLSGRNVYAGTNLYNYSPVWAGVVAALWKWTRGDFSRFVLLVGLLQNASDMLSALLVGRIALRLGRTAGQARLAALLFFSNPVSVLASSAHGQFDGLAILPLLGAILVGLRDGIGSHPRSITGLLAASLLVKHVTLFQPLLFWRGVRRPGLSGLALAVPCTALAISLLPFASASRAIWNNVIAYGSHGAQGGALLHLIDLPGRWRLALTGLLAVMVAWALREGRDVELPRASLLLWLTTLTFLPGYGVQYLVWPLAVGALYPSMGLGMFSLAGAVFHSGSSLNLPWPVRVYFQGTWAAGALWLAMEAGRVREERVAFSAAD